MMFRIGLLFTLATGLTSTASAAETLQWQLNRGEQLVYMVENDMQIAASVGNQNSQSRLRQVMEIAWDVRNVAANGNFVVGQVIRRIKVEMTPTPDHTIVYDSASPPGPVDPTVSSLRSVFGQLVNQQFTVTMQPTGEIIDVRIPDTLLETLKTAAAGAQTGLDEKSLKQMLGQTAVILPAKPIARGDSWPSEQTIDLPFGRLIMTPTMEYQGLNSDGLAEIRYEPQVQLQPKKGAEVQLTLKGSSGQGRVLFNHNSGRIDRMSLSIEMNMEAGVRGQKVSQQISQTTKMILRQ